MVARRILVAALFAFAALLVAVPTEAGEACAEPKPPAIVRLLDLLAPDAEAQEGGACIWEPGPKSCGCIEDCEDRCWTDWWECCSNCTQKESFACDRTLAICLDTCSCGSECLCGMWHLDCYC